MTTNGTVTKVEGCIIDCGTDKWRVIAAAPRSCFREGQSFMPREFPGIRVSDAVMRGERKPVVLRNSRTGNAVILITSLYPSAGICYAVDTGIAFGEAAEVLGPLGYQVSDEALGKATLSGETVAALVNLHLKLNDCFGTYITAANAADAAAFAYEASGKIAALWGATVSVKILGHTDLGVTGEFSGDIFRAVMLCMSYCFFEASEDRSFELDVGSDIFEMRAEILSGKRIPEAITELLRSVAESRGMLFEFAQTARTITVRFTAAIPEVSYDGLKAKRPWKS